MRKTDILEVVSRKLAPYMFLFGFYLVSHGQLSPGGGFQGGVVIASGVILLAMSKNVATVEAYFPGTRLAVAEAVAFGLLLAAGVLGMVLGVGFLGNFFREPKTAHVFLLNLLIGVKVGAGISLICLHLFRRE
jgi:multicomponent Na+:H+ antiporter subunit B